MRFAAFGLILFSSFAEPATLPRSLKCRSQLKSNYRTIGDLQASFPFFSTATIQDMSNPSRHLEVDRQLFRSPSAMLDDYLASFMRQRPHDKWIRWSLYVQQMSNPRLLDSLEGKFVIGIVTILGDKGEETRTFLGTIAAFDPSRAYSLKVTELGINRLIALDPDVDKVFVRQAR